MEIKEKKCGSSFCKNHFKPFRTTDKFCSLDCAKKNKKPGKPKKIHIIPKVSKKRKIEQLKYSSSRLIFLQKEENRVCPVNGKPTTEIHHKKGRIGSLFLDERFWMAVSSEGHKWIHENDKESREKGWLMNRNEK